MNRPLSGELSVAPRMARPGWLKSTFLLLGSSILSLGVFLCVAELYLRQEGWSPYTRTYPGQFEDEGGTAWARADPLLGWTLNPDRFPQQVNPQGFRNGKDFASLPPTSSTSRVMILGDSFVAGSRDMTADKTLPGMLQGRLGDEYEVFTLAVPGWGIDQMYLAYERYKDAIRPDVVILAFIDDDIKRVLEAYRVAERLSKPSFTVVNGRLTARAANTHGPSAFGRAIGKSVLLSFMAREGYLATDARAVVGQVFLNLGRDVKLNAGKAVILRIPTRDNDHVVTTLRRRFYDFETLVAGVGATYVDAAEVVTTTPTWKEDLYVEDGHLNANGTKLVVDFLFKNAF